MRSNLINELKALRKHMMKNQLAPNAPMIADNKRHEYLVSVDGEIQMADYTITLFPFKDDPMAPDLICFYGLINAINQYTYSSLINT